MIIVGLTGSIGMGKSTAAAALRRLGAAVHDSDAAVHRMTGPGGPAVSLVDTAFPGVVQGGAVDRRLLGQRVFSDPAALARLEALLHPLVLREQRAFLRAAARRRQRVVVLDVPLLFETGANWRVDRTIVVSAPPAIQRARVLGRPGMTEAAFRRVLARQMSDQKKRRLADFVVCTGRGKACSLRALRRLFRVLANLPACRWRPGWPD